MKHVWVVEKKVKPRPFRLYEWAWVPASFIHWERREDARLSCKLYRTVMCPVGFRVRKYARAD